MLERPRFRADADGGRAGPREPLYDRTADPDRSGRALRSYRSVVTLLLLSACGGPAAPDPCALLAAKTPGPLAAERASAGDDPLKVGQLYFEEGRRTSDAGFYTLAEAAATCALERDPESVPAQRLRLDTW
jgi:hypothetical protein